MQAAKRREALSGETALGTRDRLLEAAIALMRRGGVSAAGINEIVKEGGIPKGSIYHFFPGGKRQILSEALARYSERIVAALDAALSSRSTPRAKIIALFDVFERRLEDGDFRSSCAAGTVSLDLDDDLETVRVVIAAIFTEWQQVIGRHFSFEDDRKRASFASTLLSVIEGAYLRGRAEHSTKAFKDAAVWLADIADAAPTRTRKTRK